MHSVDGNGAVDSQEWGQAVAKHAAVMRRHFGGGGDLKAIGKAFNRIAKDGVITWEAFEAFCGEKK